MRDATAHLPVLPDAVGLHAGDASPWSPHAAWPPPLLWLLASISALPPCYMPAVASLLRSCQEAWVSPSAGANERRGLQAPSRH